MLQLKCFLKNPGFSIRGIEQISALGCGGRGNKISQIEGVLCNFDPFRGIFNMIDNQHHMPKGGWIAAVVSALGAAIFFLWQPVMEYFITGTYDDNIVIQLEAQSMKSDAEQRLIVLRVKAANKGNVPVRLTSQGKGDLTIEIRKLGQTELAQWVDPTSYPVVARKLVLVADSGDLTVPPNSYWSKEVSIPLSPGMYWINSTLKRKDGDQISEAIYFEHTKIMVLR